MLDRKGIAVFLIITFSITYAVEFALLAAGVRFDDTATPYAQLVVAALMWVPALTVFITLRFVTKEGFAETGLRVGAWKPYLWWMLMMPVIFAVTYGLTWLLGLASPDWQLTDFMELMGRGGADLSAAPPSAVILGGLFFATTFVTPFINGLVCFGEEFGWRGYLLPKLMPLGKLRAYIIMGIIWGLWHLPLVIGGFTYPGYPVIGVIALIMLTTAFGIVLNELRLRYQSSILAGWVHGLFNSQKLGVWPLLFPGVNPLLGGFPGLVGIAVWLALGVWLLWRARNEGATAQLQP